jgi:tetratricopeptide (TPR) repeat protein
MGHEDVATVDESLGQRICEAAGVHALVIPTVRRFGDLYTIDLKIMDTRSRKYIYTTRKEGRGQESIPGMIDEIARDIRIDLHDPSEAVASTAPLGEVTTTNLDAYQAYFEGETLLNDLDFGGATRAFQYALERDSTFALAHYRLGYVEWWTRRQPDETRRHIAYALDNLNRVPQKERYLVRAIQASLDGGFEAQIPVLKEMRGLYPKDKEMLFFLGDAEFHSAQYDSAVVHLSAALAVDPNMDRALQHLTWTYLRLDRFDEATRTAERWVQSAPSAEAYDYLSFSHFKRGDMARASQILEAVSKRYPDSPKIPLRVAGLQFATGKPQEALRSLDAAANLAEKSDDIQARMEVGAQRSMVVYPYLGRYRDALQELRSGRESVGESLDDSTLAVSMAMSSAALIYWGYQDPQRALAVLDEVSGASPRLLGPDYQRSVAVFSVLTGDTARAHAVMREHGKKLTPVRLGMIKMLEASRSGQCARAQELERALRDEKGYVASSKYGIDFMIGNCLLESGDYDGAVTRLRRMLGGETVASETASMYALGWVRLGNAYEKKGEASKAMDCYRKVLAIQRDGDDDVVSRREARAGLDRLTIGGTM